MSDFNKHDIVRIPLISMYACIDGAMFSFSKDLKNYRLNETVFKTFNPLSPVKVIKNKLVHEI